MKHELLVPVGNYESLIAAINNGADAVYLAGKKFGARAFADNFNEEQLKAAIKLCHLYDVKIYITVNTLIFENEMNEALEYIGFLHENGVDAVIMQDVGLINLVHNTYPNLEIHASTQMHNHSKESLNFLKELGIKRVVFAREMSFDYLNAIDTDLEKEVFIHGALCISYSGQCLFSSCILGRSGNRGACAGMCRLPYKLLENDKYIDTEGDYLLSPKDLCSIEDFEKLMHSNIKSFKIEGRMKSPAYVAVVTRIYKTLMNQYEKGEELKVNEQDFELLKAIFNREYTKGFLQNDLDIMNIKAPNHMGVFLGKVIGITPKKIKIKLDHDLKQFEGIRFKNANKGMIVNFLYNENDNLINSAGKGDIVYLDNFLNLNDIDEVVLTTPMYAIEKNIIKKIKININVEAKLNKPLKIKVTDGINVLVEYADIISQAKSSPVTPERIKEAVSKVGNTPFEIREFIIESDNNIFVPISVINTLRRNILEKLKLVRENNKKEVIIVDYLETCNVKPSDININVLVRTKEQLKACKELGINNIIVEDPSLMEENLIYKIPRDKINHNYNYQKYVVTDYASLDRFPLSIADYYLNVTNSYTLNYLAEKAKSVMLSVELNDNQIKEIMNHFKGNINVEVLVYGKVELMLMKYCPLKKLINKDDVCSVCQNGNKYYLEDRNYKRYPILSNPLTHSTTILHYETINKIKEIKNYQKLGITSFRIELYDENYDKTLEILKNVNLL